MPKTKTELGQIRWRCCRRGMLELDVMLGDFFDQRFSKLSDAEQDSFVQLLEEPDPTLYDWLLGHESPEDPAYLVLIKKIRAV